MASTHTRKEIDDRNQNVEAVETGGRAYNQVLKMSQMHKRYVGWQDSTRNRVEIGIGGNRIEGVKSAAKTRV